MSSDDSSDKESLMKRYWPLIFERAGYDYVISLLGFTIEDTTHCRKEFQRCGITGVPALVVLVPTEKKQYKRIDFVLSDSTGGKVNAWITTYSTGWSDAINFGEGDNVDIQAYYEGDRLFWILDMMRSEYKKTDF